MALNALRQFFSRVCPCVCHQRTRKQSLVPSEESKELPPSKTCVQKTQPLRDPFHLRVPSSPEVQHNSCHQDSDLHSDISSENLTEYGDLLYVPFVRELSEEQEILCDLPLVEVGIASCSTENKQLTSSSRVVEQELLYSADSISDITSLADQDIIMETVEQVQAPPGEVDRVPSPEDNIVSNGDSMHDSSESEKLAEELGQLVNNNMNVVVSDKEDSSKTESKLPKDKGKEEKKSKKKEDKTIEHILRALSSLHSTEEKLAALCKKYADLHEEHRTLQTVSKQNQRKITVVTREKDQLQTEHTKAVMAKSKLEALCRELQKHNQTIRQESLQRAREEDEKRKEISTKFQTTIGEIQQQMQDHHDRNMKLREENQELAGKLKGFIEQYEAREKQVETIMQHREIETKLADAKLMKSEAILAEEQERNKKEKEIASEAQKKSVLLEAQLTMYKERYEEFQTTINRSNEMFQKFKTEMDKMTKRIKKLEKDGASWKSKFENANKALLEMAEEKTIYDKEKPALMGKIQKLESLCRAMQAERLGRKVLEASLGTDITKLDDQLAASQSSFGASSNKLSSSQTLEASNETIDQTASQEVKDTQSNDNNCDNTSSPDQSISTDSPPDQSESADTPSKTVADTSATEVNNTSAPAENKEEQDSVAET